MVIYICVACFMYTILIINIHSSRDVIKMKTLNIVQTQNNDLDHWKMSIDHKKASIGKCQQNFNDSQ